MENRVEEYILFHPDRGIEKQINYSKNRDPLDYFNRIADDVCAFRFFNEEEGYSPMYLVGKRVSPEDVSDLVLYMFGIRGYESVVITRNGCFFTPDKFPNSITLDEYTESIQKNEGCGCIKQLLKNDR